MDECTRELIVKLLDQDAQTEIKGWKGKQKAGSMSDRQLAISDWASELQQCAQSIQDQKMALSIAKAVYNDGVALALAAQEENRTLADRMTALRIGGQHQLAEQQPMQRLAAEMAQQATRALEFLYTTDHQDDTISLDGTSSSCMAESSKDAERRHVEDEIKLECAACMDSAPPCDILKAPCSHLYCRKCVTKLVESSLIDEIDESLFPPRCCRTSIFLSSVRTFLGPEIGRQLEEKSIEREDPYRTYCSSTACAKYIMPFHVQGYIGTCRICQCQTCTLCKRQAHPGAECVDDYGEVLNIAKEQGWQRCARCRNIVELGIGCNHITCRCRYEFCYICGKLWKNCTCELWDEERLLNRAQQVAGRDQVEPPAQTEVQRVAQNLRARHECDHEGRWKRINRGQGCEECHHYLPDFILECRQCHLRACTRCRMNRL
ncbi:putative E3 ubiquitin ligase [Aspergillus ellipticus CBS 707.79]|uniref:RBR-type E3 ubiquitin transferase n=1 Tax=Aspergillus ellipticus CBS 707.79 TaxID=1448320 RepID=A0A319D5M7_9EURO|nr:putative E3 ubiquitin ligase [Aspergillus ellipticus CBS 707.79]